MHPSFREKNNAQGRTLGGLVWVTSLSWTNHETKRIGQVTCSDWSSTPGYHPGHGVLLAAFTEIIMRGGKDLCPRGIGGIIAQKKGGHEPHTQEATDVHCSGKHSFLHEILKSTPVINKVGKAGACSTLIPSTGIGFGSTIC